MAATTTPDVAYAGFWRRLLALTVDLGIATVASYGLAYGVGALLVSLQMNLNRIIVVGNLIGLLVFWLYWSLFETSSFQATPGKLLLAIQVTDLEAKRTGFGRTSARNLTKILSVVLLYGGFILAAFTGKKQALHDLIAGCLVIQKPAQRQKKRSRTKKLTK